jgi:hypothetical protein
MDSSNLFSHPQKPEYISKDRNNDPVSMPMFSDRQDRKARS